MKLLENTATTTIVNLFNSHQRENYKAKLVFDFLLTAVTNEYRFEDINSVTEQESNEEGTSIPDFVINFGQRTERRYEVKINNAPLTEAERVPGNRHVFLVPRDYTYIDNIKDELRAEILFWEDLFDLLDEHNVVIDGLDKVRESLNYHNINLEGKLWEILARLNNRCDNILIDYDSIEFDWNNKDETNQLRIPMFENADGNAMCRFFLKNKSIWIYDSKTEKESVVIRIQDLKGQRNIKDIVDHFFASLIPYIRQAKLENFDISFDKKYDMIESSVRTCEQLLDISNGWAEFYCNDEKSIYAYLCKGNTSKLGNFFEIGFGHTDNKPFSETQKNELRDKLNSGLAGISGFTNLRTFTNKTWVCNRFTSDSEVETLKQEFQDCFVKLISQ